MQIHLLCYNICMKATMNRSVLHQIPDSELREYLGWEELDYKASLPGLELVEFGGINSTGKSCDEHVFSTEPWYSDMFRTLLFEPGALFILEDAGYEATNQPSVGDVASYLTDWAMKGHLSPVHYGKVVGNNLIESKFGENGSVFRHEADHVPKIYGEFILFIHK